MEITKIITKEEKERKVRRNQIIMGVLLIVLMVLSTVGFAFTDNFNNEEKIKYNNVKFTKDSGYWSFNVNGNNFLTLFSPKETEDISSIEISIQDYIEKPLYLIGDDGEHFSEIAINLNGIVKRINRACLDEKDCKEDFPVKDCSNNIIIFEDSKENMIDKKENCVFIKSGYSEFIRYTDRFLFDLLDIQ